jgi:hypothetical protein
MVVSRAAQSAAVTVAMTVGMSVACLVEMSAVCLVVMTAGKLADDWAFHWAEQTVS